MSKFLSRCWLKKTSSSTAQYEAGALRGGITSTGVQGPSLLENFGGDKPLLFAFDDATMSTQP